MKKSYAWLVQIVLLGIILGSIAGCRSSEGNEPNQLLSGSKIEILEPDPFSGERLVLPNLDSKNQPVTPLNVVATTAVIGDVVAHVGKEAINLTILITAGQEPHSFEPGARDLTAVSQADVIFINGWNLEEGLLQNLDKIGPDIPIVPISANIDPLPLNQSESESDNETFHQGNDPHVWLDVKNVKQWVENVAIIFSALDPMHEEMYQQNAADYLKELDSLEQYAHAQLIQIPAENRILVTNHDAFGYFAAAYQFEILGTIIPNASTLAEPSAADLTNLINNMETHQVCSLFTETAVSDSLAQTVAAELNNCPQVDIVPLYAGSLGPPGSSADSYIGMFQSNIDAIVNNLTP